MNDTVTPDPDDSLAPATEELVFRVIRQQETDVDDLLEQFPDASEILRNASRYLFGELTASLPTAEQVPDASGNTTLPRRPEGPSEPADEIGRLERGRGQEICRRFETELERGLSPRIEDCVSDVVEPQRSALFSMLLAAELRFRLRRGEQITLDEYLPRFSEHRELTEAVFAGVVGPERIGPFVVLGFLGGGTFGKVYLGRDTQLDRLVAIKVPRPERFSGADDLERFIQEARLAARIKHPGIVTVYHVDRDQDLGWFVVLEYIEGRTLSALLRAERITCAQAVEMMILVALAITFAHEQGLVHRDLKPENILLDTNDRPHIADFGLAVHQDELWPRSGEIAGSPAYMAPEQVRGESHRLDGRTDLWALGVILYRMLTGARPFDGANTDLTFDEILNREPVPLRQRDRTVPKELERICLKCLSKRMSDRYDTAADLADDLRHWLRFSGSELLADTAAATSPEGARTPLSTDPVSTGSVVSLPAPIRPKGLRAFDGDDQDFFLGLLPGPCDREGLPESLRFWKTRIEPGERQDPFAVGLLCGPSGCGKTSMIRAGLLCRLSATVIPVYVEASPGTTEARLLVALKRVAAGRAGCTSLVESVAGMRTRALLPQGRKVLIVLDQFEQWLHADYAADGELAQALRQCDGVNVQCLLLVRDDFAMTAARLMQALEIRLIESQNFATVDLFDVVHARKVLRAFGLAYDRFGDGEKGTQDKFLDQAVAELAQDGKIAPVRLALFAQMIKDKPWTQMTLKEVGGLEGVGVTFLEESLASPAANPEHRLHAPAARYVLRALLPDGGADIKGHMRSYDELLEASGYAHRPRDFDTLLAILGTELRLITPTDPEGVGKDEGERRKDQSVPTSDSGSSLIRHPSSVPRYYHLTHDYLVSSLQSWLTRKQRETRRGRAELRLAAITNQWKDRPTTRRLPAPLEWLEALAFTRPRSWSTDERRMIQAATRHYLTVLGLAACLIIAAIVAVREFRNRERSTALLARAVKADLRQVPELLGLVSASWPHLLGPLERLEREPAAPEAERRMVALLLFSGNPTERRAAVLRESLAGARPDEVAIIRDVLALHPDRSGADLLKRELCDESADPAIRLRAACALARLRPTDVVGQDSLAALLTQALLAEDRRSQGGWIELLKPTLGLFLGPLLGVCSDPRTDPTMLSTAAEALGETLVRRGDAAGLARAVVQSRPEASNILRRDLSRLEDPGPALDFFRDVMREEQTGESRTELLASRKVNAAIALAALGEPEALWLQLKHRPDPRVRALLIRRMGASGLNPSVLIERLAIPDLDPAERQALLLGLAEADDARFTTHTRDLVVLLASRLYREDSHAAVGSAAELLLRRWGRPPEPRQEGDARTAVRAARRDSPSRLVGPNGHVFAVLPAPLEFRMGSPEHESGRSADETLHFRRINRSLAVATKELTIEQFRKFAPASYPGLPDDHEPGYPANDLSWYDAVGYCNWLSKQAGIDPGQWCYPAAIVSGMRISTAAVERYGFRLPTEAEWEYFCRAGTETSRPLGESEDSLSGFAWTWLNSGDRTHPTGRLLPNEFGLFDILGNVWEWCHDGPLTAAFERTPYPAATQNHPAGDSLADLVIMNRAWRSLRGGAYDYTPTTARSAHRDVSRVETRNVYIGMRVVRTLPPAGQP